MKDDLIPPHGGYRELRSWQTAQLVYDATVLFLDRFVSRSSRTYDQMEQAARSGVRNIAEGSMASATSKKSEIKLTNVARASLEELEGDFRDYLRHHRLPVWDKESHQALAVRRRYRSRHSDLSDASAWSDQSDPLDPYGISAVSAEVAANTIICLINQATYLLRRQIEALKRQFLEDGGFTERLYRERKKRRSEQRNWRRTAESSDQSDLSDWSD